MRKPDYTRRIAVTGLGIVSPIGNDKDTVWENLVSGRSGIGEITHFDTTPYEHKAGGEVHDFDVTKFWNFKDARRTDTTVHFAVASAKMAVADAGLEINDDNRYDIGVIYGSGGGGQALFISNQEIWHSKGARSVSPFFIANGLVDAAPARSPSRRGPRATTSARCRPVRPARRPSARPTRRSAEATAPP